MTNEELVARIQAGIDVAENTLLLYQRNKGLIAKVAFRYRGYGEIEDLKQEGYFGFYEALNRYNPDMGATFASYAWDWIRQAIQRYVFNHGDTVRIPAHMKERMAKYKKIVMQFERECSRTPTDDELCYYLELSERQLKELKDHIKKWNMQSLDDLLNQEDGSMTIGDTVDSGTNIENEIIETLDHQRLANQLWSIVDSLDPKQSSVIQDRYIHNFTLRELGEARKISIEAARQIESKALQTLRRKSDIKEIGKDYDYIRSKGMTGVSVGAFNRTWTSATEYTALWLAEQGY